MNASERGSKDWWAVVLTMPDSETALHLEGYRRDLAKSWDKTSQKLLEPEFRKINFELKKINLRLDSSSWYCACKNILAPDVFDAVLVEKVRLKEVAQCQEA